VTDAKRKAAERQRKKAAGLVRVDDLWVPPERVQELRAIAERMRKERDDE
jgi:predicted DNA repair protein MutK